MSKHLIVDPAGTTGYCLVDVDGENANITHFDLIHIDTSSDYLGDHCIDFKKKIEKLLDDYNIESVGIEDYMARGKFVTGLNTNVSYRAAVHMACRERNIHYQILNVTQWKKWVAGTSSPNKLQKKMWGKEAAKKVYIQEALWEKYDIRFPNHSISDKTGKPVKFKYDVVDAVGQAVFYLENYMGVKYITCSVEISKDVVLKNNSKSFIYPED